MANLKARYLEANLLALQLLSDDPTEKIKAITHLCKGSAKLLALTIRHIQSLGGRKSTDIIRSLCDYIGNQE